MAKKQAIRATAAEKQTAETLVKVAAERDAKELARKDAADISTFLSNVMQSPDPTRDGREIKVVELLDNAARKLETDLADQPAQRAKLQYTLGNTYDALGLYQQAIPLQEQARDYNLTTSGPEHPDTLGAMSDLAVSYHAAGRRDEALQLREEVLTLRPDDATAHNDAAWTLATSPDKDGRYPQAKQAVTWARQANELSPNNGALLNTLEVTLYRDEQWQETIDVLQQSIKLGIDVPHNWLFIAMAHWQLDQKDKAKQWYDKALAWQTANQSAAKADTELQGFFTESAKLMAPANEGASAGKTKAKTESKKSKTRPADSESKDKSEAS